ncbi:MAG: gliding motility-associated C-terminal domain-containing protein [Bacteroidota bacterium]|nr:gliding motility-associated C-terminal domain-containing protein [Bacteroidota bacterium]
MVRLLLRLFFVFIFVISLFSCLKDDSILLESEIIVPTIFTPNGDGVNDTFKVIGKNITSFNMTIFNSKNVLMYSTSDIKQGWDGISDDKPAPQGNYSFVIRFAKRYEDSKTLAGNIELVR